MADVHAHHSKEQETPSRTNPTDPHEAMIALREGNLRFAEGRVLHAHQAADWRSHLTGGQQPFATILSCSDSRVPPELVFDQGLGDLFVIRVAGNIIDADVVGSISYAVRHLKTRLVVVMGHEKCGAVTAALQALHNPTNEGKYISELLHHIIPTVSSLDPEVYGAGLLEAAVEANVFNSTKRLQQISLAADAIEQNAVRIEAAVYELSTGRVRFLDRPAN